MKRLFIFAALLSLALLAHAQQFTKLTVASWNIGHFALGKSGDTKLKHDVLPFYQHAYRNYFNTLNADILCLVEYNPLMVNATEKKEAVDARQAILSNYSVAQIGPKYSYNCNAIFSNGLRVISTDTVMFSKMMQRRYYLVSTMLIGTDTVKVVSSHLDWNQGDNGAAYRAIQIQELIDAFRNDRYVIMCADWNTEQSSEYDAFTEAGYSMANHSYLGDLMTYPTGDNPRKCLDNIIAKGFAVSNIQVINDPMLSDHCLIRADLTKLP